MCSRIISLNGLDIMITLNNVFFEYIKNLCKIFVNYIVPTLQIYPNHFIILLKIITNYYYYYYYYYIFILITCDRKINFNIILIKILK